MHSMFFRHMRTGFRKPIFSCKWCICLGMEIHRRRSPHFGHPYFVTLMVVKLKIIKIHITNFVNLQSPVRTVYTLADSENAYDFTVYIYITLRRTCFTEADLHNLSVNGIHQEKIILL